MWSCYLWLCLVLKNGLNTTVLTGMTSSIPWTSTSAKLTRRKTVETTDTSLKIERTFDIGIDEMWELWTDPAKISVWHRPNTTEFTTKAEGEAKVGRPYKISMNHHGKTD